MAMNGGTTCQACGAAVIAAAHHSRADDPVILDPVPDQRWPWYLYRKAGESERLYAEYHGRQAQHARYRNHRTRCPHARLSSGAQPTETQGETCVSTTASTTA